MTAPLKAVMGESAFIKLAADPVAFVMAFDRKPYDFQAATLRSALEINRHGFKHRIVVVSWPRQNGKSTLSGWAALHRFYCDHDPQEIVSVALDRDSARIILNDARRIISNSSVLHDLVDPAWGLTKNSIRLRDGRTWTVKSADAVYSRGLRPTMVLFDELGWSSDDGDLFQVLTAGMAAAPHPLMLITSTVGPIMAGPLWDLVQADDPAILVFHEHENKSPRITQKYLDEQRAILPPSVYAREHENRWGEGSDVFCTQVDWERATSEYDPARGRDLGPTFCFVDLGWSHDETAIAISKAMDDKVDVIHLRGIRGSRSEPVSLPAVQQHLEDLVGKFGIHEIHIEAPQGLGMAQGLMLKGIQAEVIYPTAKSNSERWGSLYTGLKNGGIRLPKDRILRRQLLTLTIKESLAGWKVIDVPSIHQDRAVAVAGAYHMASRVPDWLIS